MSECPVVELMITFRYGIPVFSWVNPNKKDMASAVGESFETQNLISGLLSAILSFSESISSESVVKQIKMAKITYQYSISDTLIFFVGYDSKAPKRYETQIDNFLFEAMEKFDELYNFQIGDDMKLVDADFSDYRKYLLDNINSDEWRIEKSQSEILADIQELLQEILGPMSEEIFKNNLRELKYISHGKDIDLEKLAGNLVTEISLLMEPSQARQIGDEINTLITV